VVRGGSWFYDAWNCRVANRYHICNDPHFRYNDLGFRVV
jgi:formylglycine-generating enzyme required for sulfatase activity